MSAYDQAGIGALRCDVGPLTHTGGVTFPWQPRRGPHNEADKSLLFVLTCRKQGADQPYEFFKQSAFLASTPNSGFRRKVRRGGGACGGNDPEPALAVGIVGVRSALWNCPIR